MARERKKLDRMSAHEFVRRLKDHADESDRHYTFWLGAGCSVTSGIPAAAALVGEHWLPGLHRLKGQQDRSVKEWASTVFPAYDPENLAALYGPVMDALFPLKEDRQRETERLCEKGVPGFGYAILAALMSRPDGVFSGALTTNFDDLVADSMYVYGAKRPLVIQHDALSGFVRPGRVRRPLVVKVHGDHRLNPMHTSIETAELEKGIQRGIHGLLHDRGVIFVGYAGNDRGVLRALEGLPAEAIPLGVWWASRREPTSAIRDWLDSRDATWVQVDGFDELMLLFREEFEIVHPTAQKFERMIERYRETYEHLGVRVEDLPETAPDSEALKEAARNARNTAEDWWKVDLEARQFFESDPAQAERIYQEGVERLEDARLFNNYAIFLNNIRKDPDRAEEFYKRSLEIDSSNADVLGNYALLLHRESRDPDRAEAYYKRALEAAPDRAGSLGNYALFLKNIRKDPDRAEEFYKRSLEIDSSNADVLGNYALLLHTQRKDPDRAEEYYKRALEAAPEHANNLGNYANFLIDVRNDPDGAEEYYKRALEAAPEHANNLGNYASFLVNFRKDPDAAEESYKRSLEANPEDPVHLGNYANFLKVNRNDPDRAEEYYKRALEAAPEHANNLGNYANFLIDVRNDPDRAEEYYKRALEAAPEHANNLGNYGRLLLEKGEDDQAWAVLERALDGSAEDPLRAEIFLYTFALGDKQHAENALAQLIPLVKAGARSPGWDFSRVIARAREGGHPDPERLQLLADVVSGRADPEALD